MGKTVIILASVFLITMLSACADAKTLEKMGLITTMGYDLTEDGQILTTLVLLQIDPEATKNSTILTGISATSKGSRNKGDLKSPKKLQSGQLRVALYSEEIAEFGIINLADTLARDPAISDLTYLAVVEGSTNKLLEQKNPQFTDISQLIYKELDQNIKGELIPSSTLQETLHDYYAAGIDPILPTLKPEDGQVRITGMALLKDDKMVGKINSTEAFYLKLINDRYDAGSLELTIDKAGFKILNEDQELSKLAVVIDTIHSKSDIKLTDRDQLIFNLKIKLKTRLLEVNQSIDLKNPKNLKTLENKLKDQIKKDVEALLTKAQSMNSDPFGIGEIYRKSVRNSNLTSKKWHDMYPDSKVNVVIDFEIMRTGVVE